MSVNKIIQNVETVLSNKQSKKQAMIDLNSLSFEDLGKLQTKIYKINQAIEMVKQQKEFEQ